MIDDLEVCRHEGEKNKDMNRLREGRNKERERVPVERKELNDAVNRFTNVERNDRLFSVDSSTEWHRSELHREVVVGRKREALQVLHGDR